MTPRFAMPGLVAGLLVAGCAPGVVQDPNYFWFTSRDGMSLGNYNADTFSQAEVRSVVAASCKGGTLSDYSDQVNAEGVTVFSGYCANGGRNGPGRYDTDKLADGSLRTRFIAY